MDCQRNEGDRYWREKHKVYIVDIIREPAAQPQPHNRHDAGEELRPDMRPERSSEAGKPHGDGAEGEEDDKGEAHDDSMGGRDSVQLCEGVSFVFVAVGPAVAVCGGHARWWIRSASWDFPERLRLVADLMRGGWLVIGASLGGQWGRWGTMDSRMERTRRKCSLLVRVEVKEAGIGRGWQCLCC